MEELSWKNRGTLEYSKEDRNMARVSFHSLIALSKHKKVLGKMIGSNNEQ